MKANTVETPPPPAFLMKLDVVHARFGQAQAALVERMARTGDPLADAAVAEAFAGRGDGWSRLDRGVVGGLVAEPDAGPAMRALLEQAETLPAWVEADRLARGSEAYLAIGSLWITFSLGPGSLVHTYASPTIAKVLIATGNLTDRTTRRLQETGAWSKQTVMPGGLAVGADGYVHTLQVRLLHARVRAGLLAKSWDTDQFGAPIHQLDLARTWLDFTYIPFSALMKIGVTFTRAELEDLYHLWRYVAHLLGIDPALYAGVSDQKGAERLLAMIDGVLPPPNAESRILTRALLEAGAAPVGEILHIPPSVALDLLHALTRRFQGDAVADALQIRRPWLRVVLPLITLANRFQRWRQRLWPSVRARAIRATIADFHKQLAEVAGPTVYQRAADTPDRANLPRSEFPGSGVYAAPGHAADGA